MVQDVHFDYTCRMSMDIIKLSHIVCSCERGEPRSMLEAHDTGLIIIVKLVLLHVHILE